MTLEEKVGQLLMVHFHGQEANEDAKTLIQKTHVGGIIYYNWSNELSSPEQVKSLSQGLQQLAQATQANHQSIPLFIAVDQEGGIVARIQGLTVFPGNKALGMTFDPALAELSAFAIGQELHSVGVNLNLSPVVDVNSNPRNPIIGIRSFGDSPDTVVIFAEHALKGYRKSGIITCLKHFPGHGDVGIDSHEDLPVVNKSKEELEKIELFPFSKLAHQADTIMTAHILVRALDNKQCATLSKKTLDILRNEIGFDGVIIADSLVMEGVLKNCASVDEAAIQALQAGCDILMLGGKQLIGTSNNRELTVADVQRIHKALVDAVRSGRVPEERLNDAVQRIMELKERYLAKSFDKPVEIGSIVNSTEHQSLAKTIASRALKSIINDAAVLDSIRNKKIAVIAPKIIRESIHQTSLPKVSEETQVLFYNELNPSVEDIESIVENVKNAEIIIFCSYNAWKNLSQLILVGSFLDKPTILVVLRDSLDSTLLPKASLVLITHSPTVPSIQAVADLLSDPAFARESVDTKRYFQHTH